MAERLTQLGQRAWAERISSAIEDGATATEILMALRWQLGELQAAAVPLDDSTRDLVKSLHADIDNALR